MSTWRDRHGSWTYRVWRERQIDALSLVNAELYRTCIGAGMFDAAADVARVEILLREGGVYVDADSICHRPLDGASFLEAGFFAVHEPTPLADDPVTNAFMGARPDHPVLERYLGALATIDDPRPQWRNTGPVQLSEAIRAGDERDVIVLPGWTFMTRTAAGDSVTGGDPFGEHFFSSTAERSDRWLGARGYLDGKFA